jgi:hypothetical protein
VNNLIVSAYNNEFATGSLGDNSAEYGEASESRSRGAWGAISGVLLGASLWGAILLSVGVIKL